jgi:hypothetical protein
LEKGEGETKPLMKPTQQNRKEKKLTPGGKKKPWKIYTVESRQTIKA